MASFSNKRIAVVILILVISTSLEVYAHTYVQIHDLPVVTEEEVDRFLTWQNPTGTYTFSKGGCRWFVGWIIRIPAQYKMPKGGHAVGTMYMDSEEGVGFTKENFIFNRI